MRSLSLTGKRIVSGIALVQMLFFILNYYRFHLFEPYDKKVMVLSVVIVGIWVLFFMPSIEEMREHRRKHST